MLPHRKIICEQESGPVCVWKWSWAQQNRNFCEQEGGEQRRQAQDHEVDPRKLSAAWADVQ